MIVSLLDSLLAYTFLFWLNVKFANLTAGAFEAFFRYLERQGAEDVCSECLEFKSPPD